jgi:hypothetical protein
MHDHGARVATGRAARICRGRYNGDTSSLPRPPITTPIGSG